TLQPSNPPTLPRTATILLPLGAAIVSTSSPAASAQNLLPDPDDPNPFSDAELVSEVTSIQPGATFTVALRQLMGEHWHRYWKSPGDSGQETYIEWELPEGFEAGEIQWPYPERIDAGPLSSYGYSDEVFLLTDITAP